MLNSFLLGIGITMVYDSLRIFRRVYPHRMFWVSVEDLLYWVFAACSIFYLLYYENNGTFRWFAIVGMLLGMLLYNRTVSPFLVKWISRFFIRIRKLWHRCTAFVMKPVRLAGRAVGGRAAAVLRRGRRFFRIVKKQLTVYRRMVKLIVKKRCKKVQRGRKNG